MKCGPVGGHVKAAVSCCQEMALWRTLWMADQVSRIAGGGLSASFMRLLMNLLAWCSGRPVISKTKGTRLMCEYLSNPLWLKNRVHTRVLPLSIHDAGESRDLLFNERFGTTV